MSKPETKNAQIERLTGEVKFYKELAEAGDLAAGKANEDLTLAQGMLQHSENDNISAKRVIDDLQAEVKKLLNIVSNQRHAKEAAEVRIKVAESATDKANTELNGVGSMLDTVCVPWSGSTIVARVAWLVGQSDSILNTRIKEAACCDTDTDL